MKTNTSRRKFLKTGATASLAIPFAGSMLYGCVSPSEKKQHISEANKLSILILGGTSFLGPHQIKYALDRGHSVSIFTRGKSTPTVHPEIFENVEHLVGDREDNLKALENRSWDLVIDNSGQRTHWTEKTAELLKDTCGMYLYTSSTGVYFPYLTVDIKEDKELLMELPDAIADEMKPSYDYGIMKAQSEQEALKAFGKERTIIVRPTYMMGPGDTKDRFMYYPLRLQQGGAILLPAPEDQVQFIDIRDAAEWMIRLGEEKLAGTFNAVGPQEKINMKTFVTEAAKGFDVEHQFVFIDDYSFLAQNQIYGILPWIMADELYKGNSRVNNDFAKQNGLTFRPLNDTVKDTLNWWNSSAVTQERRDAYLNDENSIITKEQSIITAWHKK